MADNIRFMHNETKDILHVEKKNDKGEYSKIAEIPGGKNGGPYNHIALSDLRFVVQSRKPVYFKFSPGEHEDDFTHMDGETGHPD